MNLSTVMVIFQILTATSVKMAVSLDVAQFSLVDIDRRFRGAYYLHHQGDQGEGGSKLR
jgi:hypothetical protein